MKTLKLRVEELERRVEELQQELTVVCACVECLC